MFCESYFANGIHKYEKNVIILPLILPDIKNDGKKYCFYTS